MKVEKLSIQRINVTLSCGCGVLCDFKDPQCKEPFHPELGAALADAGEVTPDAGAVKEVWAIKEFTICPKHKKDPGKSMLEFMMSERMDEAIADAQKQPVLRPSPGAMVLPQSTELQGETVQRVAIIAGAANRPKRDPTQIKKVSRSPQQLVDSGSVVEIPVEPVMDGDVEIGMNDGGATSMDQLLDIIAPERDASRGG
jgi:hypothetical protein